MDASSPRWVDDGVFELAGHRFRLARSFESMFARGEPGELLLAKPPDLVSFYHALAGALEASHIVELGIFRGGSAALLQALFRPHKMLAVDIKDETSPALDRFRRSLAAPDSLVCRFGIDQADPASLRRAVDTEFRGEPLDLVVDDASHLLEETTSSFNLLFPRLRPGGVFVIEDWPWAHRPDHPGGHTVGELFPRFQGRPALSSLVVQALLACGSGGDIVERVEVNHFCAAVYRGAAPLDDGDFDIRQAFRLSATNPLMLRSGD